MGDFQRGVEDFGGIVSNGLQQVGRFATQQDQTDRAIDAQRRSVDSGNATLRSIYDQNRDDLMPWRDAGVGALGDLMKEDNFRDFGMSDFQNDPGYQFQLDEGNKAIERAAAARGMNGSGATMKALTRYGQDYATNAFQRARQNFNEDRATRMGRLSSIAGLGQNGTNQTVGAGMNYGDNVSNNQIGYGNAVASANIAEANRMSSLLNQVIGTGGMAFGKSGKA